MNGRTLMRRGGLGDDLGLSAIMDDFFGEGGVLADFFGNPKRGSFASLAPLTDRPVIAARVDMFEEDGCIFVKAEMPGVEKDSVEVTVEDGNLVLKGSRSSEDERKDGDWMHRERSHSSFVRSVSLPQDEVNAEAISASLKDGVLTVKVPKVEKSQPKKIEVLVG